jgi:deoxycytidylate deaminase
LESGWVEPLFVRWPGLIVRLVKQVHEEMNAILEMRLNNDHIDMMMATVMAPFARLVQSICALMALRGAPRPSIVVS